MNYLFNDRNLMRSAVMTALNVVPSTAIYRTDTAAKQGGGAVQVTGPYTGNHDTTIDVEILDATGDSSQVSEPVFSGVGNGTMTDAAVTALDPQDITVTLVDLGTPTLAAQAPFQGLTLVAKEAGDEGNAITVTIDANGITRTDSIYSTQHGISAGTNQFTGSEWDFGAKALIAGKLDPETPRISFGEDPQVYRPYKIYDATQGQYVYSFSPPPIRDVPAFTTVKTVTGTWAVHITDGSSPEDFTGITTLFDAASAIQAGSALVSVEGVIVNDLTPNGMGANDLSVWTDSYVLSVTGQGSQYVTRDELQVSVASSAPTELLRVACIDSSQVGAERWSVSGDISGDLGTAISGVAFSAGAYGFTIPQQLPSGEHPGGNMLAKLDLVSRGDDEQIPVMCLARGVLGARATNRSFTFIWKKRPPADCVCERVDFVTGPDPDCLGINPVGGEDVTEDRRLLRLQRLAAAVQTLVNSNTAPSSDVAVVDVPWVTDTASILAQGLNTFAAGPKVNYPSWTALRAYGIDEQAEPTVRNGYRYVVSTAGLSGPTEPTWPTTIGDTVSDGGITWTNAGKTAFELWDEYFEAWNDEMSILSGIGTAAALRTWAANRAASYFSSGMVNGYWGCKPTSPNGIAMALFGGATTDTTGASEPTWPSTVGPIVFDGDVEWKAIKQYWISEHTYATNAIINPYSGQIFKATTGGTSGTSEPNWTAGGAVTDGDITWTPITSTDLAESANANREIYFDRFRTQMQEVNSVAGVSPNFESAGTNGDGCWQDDPSAQFWFESQDGLLPMFVDHDYHSSKLVIDEDGRPFAQSTMEFYVELQWGCPDKLKLGDQITITLEGVAGGAVTYQQGDEWDVSVAHADPLQLGGGQDGDDTLTWSVTSSIGTAFDPYELITTALAAYDDGGLTFAITPGAIDFALGDTFRLSVEGGHFRWRRDGGSWSSSTVIGDTSASDGLTIEFVGGAAPSWVGGDAWSFSAEATNGPDQAKSPTDGRFKWTGSTTLTIVPDSSGPVTRLAIYDHHIPSDAAIRLQGSDDDFSTTPTDIAITWAERNILAIFPSVTRAKWRITVDKGGDLFWAFLGDTMQPTTPNGAREAGKFVKRRRVPRLGIRGGIAGDISHEAVSQTSFEDFMTGIDYAGENDAGAFGLVLNDALGETSLVRFTGTDVEASDLRGYQSSDADLRWHGFTLPVEALP